MMPSLWNCSRMSRGSLPIPNNRRRNMATPTIVPDNRGTEEVMVSKKGWLIASVVVAVAVYRARGVGYALNGGWRDAVATDVLQPFHTLGASRPGWVSFWVVSGRAHV